MENQNWKKIFFALYTGQFFSLLSSAAVQFSIIWWLTDRSGSPLLLAIAGLAGFLPQALIGPIAGTITDRYSRKLIMLLADSTVAFASLILFIFMYVSEPSMAFVLAVLAVRSVATAFHMPAMQASVPLLAPEEHLTKVAGWGQMVSSISNIAGPAIGMSLLAVSSIEWVLLLDVLGALIACGILLFIRIPQIEQTGEMEKKSFFGEMKQGYEAIVTNRKLLKLAILMTIVAVLFIPVGTYFPLMVRNHFDKGVVEAGMVEIIFAAGLIAGGALLGILGDRFHKIKTMAAGMLLMGAALFVSGSLSPSLFYGFAVMSFLIGLSGPLFSAPFYAFIQIEIEPHLLGRVFSFITSLSLLATPIGYGFAGVFAEFTSVTALFELTGVFIMITAILTLRLK